MDFAEIKEDIVEEILGGSFAIFKAVSATGQDPEQADIGSSAEASEKEIRTLEELINELIRISYQIGAQSNVYIPTRAYEGVWTRLVKPKIIKTVDEAHRPVKLLAL